MFDRRSQVASEAFERVRLHGDRLFELLESAETSANYVKNLQSYPGFARLVATISVALSSANIPTFTSWRMNTQEVTSIVLEIRQQVVKAQEQALSGQNVDAIDPDKFHFHKEFGERMQAIDTAIQDLDWATGVRREGIKIGVIAASFAGLLLFGSLTVALAAEIKLGAGVPDCWNTVGGILLVGFTLVVCIALIQAFRVNNVSRAEWINRKVGKLTSELAKDEALPPSE